jgi:hypothetical protein
MVLWQVLYLNSEVLPVDVQQQRLIQQQQGLRPGPVTSSWENGTGAAIASPLQLLIHR